MAIYQGKTKISVSPPELNAVEKKVSDIETVQSQQAQSITTNTTKIAEKKAAIADIESRISGGGGSGKMIQQLKLPLSMIYDEFTSAKAWQNTDVSKFRDGFGADVCVNGCLYSLYDNSTLYTLNCTTLEFTKDSYSGMAGMRIGLFTYNSELYEMALITSKNGNYEELYYYVYKLNPSTKTVTLIKTFLSGKFTKYETSNSSSTTQYSYYLV